MPHMNGIDLKGEIGGLTLIIKRISNCYGSGSVGCRGPTLPILCRAGIGAGGVKVQSRRPILPACRARSAR